MSREKKFLSPILKDYSGDLKKRWRVEYKVVDDNYPNGKRAVVYGNINTGRTANQRYRLAQKLIKEIFNVPGEQKSLLQNVIDLHSIDWRVSTINAYKTVVKEFSKYYPTHEYVTTEDVRDFLMRQKTIGKSSGTLKKYRDMLHGLYERAVKLNLIKYNPVTIEIKIKKAPRSLLYFNDPQIELFKRASIPSYLMLAIELLYYCFIRPGEIRELKISYINLVAGYIEIPGEVSKNKKTEKVAVPIQLIEKLRYYYQNFPNNNYLIGKDGQPSDIQLARNHLNNAHTKVLKELNINGRYAFYSWKHTGVVKCVQAGINIKDLQMQLRHHSLDMVNEYLKNLGVMDSEDLKNRFPTL